ncbi:hypothetical protein HDR67_00860 [bacterium]|nr:hypothetical protein [bacterium]
MLQLQAILERCGARFSEPLTLETRLTELGLDSLGYVQLWTEIANEDFPINALFDADIKDWNLGDVLYFSHLTQKGSKQKIFQRRLQKSELPFVIAKCLECGSESGSAVSALAKSLKIAYKHCICEGFYMRDCKRERLPSRAEVNCLGFFIAFVQPKSVYVPIIWIDSAHQNKAISLLIWRNLAPILLKRTLTAPLWAEQHFSRYVVSEKDGILTLDSEAIVQRFKNGNRQENP